MTTQHTPPKNEMSVRMKAVMAIVSADGEIKRSLLPYIHFDREEIHWDRIFSALNMDWMLKGAVLRALAIHWKFD